MFENPRRGRQARNFKTNVPKILVLKSSSEQIFYRKLPLGAPVQIVERERKIQNVQLNSLPTYRRTLLYERLPVGTRKSKFEPVNEANLPCKMIPSCSVVSGLLLYWKSAVPFAF